MPVHGRLRGVGRARTRAGLGLAALASMWALSAISPGGAAASPGTSQREQAVSASSVAGTSLSEAPPSLRSAVQTSLGFGGPSSPRLKPRAELTASDAAQGDDFGFSLSIAGSTAVVGAPYHSGTGAAYVFVRSGSTWTQQAELAASDGAQGDGFGTRVSLSASGSTVVVGAPFRSSDDGAAYVFVRSGTTWSQQAELTASDGGQDGLGYSVAVSGSTVLLGGPFHKDDTGAAYVFMRSGTKWLQQARLTARDGAYQDFYGYSVGLSGTTAVVGSPDHDGYTGAAYVFAGSGTRWVLRSELTGPSSGDAFGDTVAISGTTILIGAPFTNTNTGAAYVFVHSGGKWSQQAALTAPDGVSGDYFGWKVAVSGSTAMVGAPYHGDGAAYVFLRSGSAWSQRSELTDHDPTTTEGFGYSVVVSRSTVVVSAPFKNSYTGAAYVYRLP